MKDFEVKILQHEQSNRIPVIRLPKQISQQELTNPQLIDIASDSFKENGVLQVDNLFSQKLINNLAQSFNRDYQPYFGDREYANSLEVGDKRRMITIKMKSAFNNSLLYGNHFLLELMQRVLGDDFILGGFEAVIALPGAKAQHIHRDHPPLFDDESIDSKIPSFAVTAVIPLVDLTEATGSTRVWKKTHRMPRSQERKMSDSFVPLMPVGSCYLMDYQLVHGGTANNSEIIRPILYLIYYRPWFREVVNLDKKKRIEITAAEYQKIPDHYRFLFAGLNLKSTSNHTPEFAVNNYLSTKKFAELDTIGQEQRLLALAKVATKDYGLENANIKLIAHRENTTFCLEIPEKVQKTEANSPYLINRYLLRIHRGNYLSPQNVASELQWLQALRQETNLPVPEAVSTLTGKLVTEVEIDGVPEPRVCSVTRWVHGEEDKPMSIKAIGKLIARMHNFTQQWQPPANFSRPSWNWQGLFGEGAGYSINNGDKIWQLTPQPYRQLFQQVGDRVQKMMEVLGEEKDQFGLIHGDMCPGNLLSFYNEIRLIDFADCGYGYWMQDIAMFISYFYRDPQVPNYLKLLLEGYAEIRPLPEKQLIYIDTFIVLQQVTLALWRVNRAQDHPYFRAILADSLREAGKHAQWYLKQCSFSIPVISASARS